VLERVTISHRGASYEIGQGRHCYAIWAVGTPRSQPLEQWPETREGWFAAWSRFTALETPGTIVTVSKDGALFSGTIDRAVVAATLLAVGVAWGIAGLFPSYLSGASLAQQPPELVPHVIYLAVWGASAALLLLGGTRARAGALLAAGTSIVTFGLFFSDAGTAIAGGAHVMGAGLPIALAGWLACAAGTAVAFRIPPRGAPATPRGPALGAVVMLMLAALGTAVAFAPSWDSYTLQTAVGTSQSLTAGNAFANPAPVIVGNVAVMVALVAVVAAAALWRPVRQGAVLLAGAIVPMAAQAISALVQASEPASPAMFGISSGQAAQSGLTISSGLTPAFWIYCLFVIALIVSCAWIFFAPPAGTATGLWPPQPGVPGAGNAAVAPMAGMMGFPPPWNSGAEGSSPLPGTAPGAETAPGTGTVPGVETAPGTGTVPGAETAPGTGTAPGADATLAHNGSATHGDDEPPS
jgi:hypothetical protein